MCVALIGGIDSLERDYKNEAVKYGVFLKVYTKGKINLDAKLKAVDAIVVFTGKTSHRIRNQAVCTARMEQIPVIMSHSCGICSLRNCLGRLVSGNDPELPDKSSTIYKS
ncbi:MAG TPA: DUF2325 domain-containing protein [Desulfotomaculum sp.]|nr:DUF2325 domain-containing protein [Desulfotomaculum sp.]